MNFIHSALDHIRDKYAYSLPTSSTFRATGQITPEEFLAAGDFLVYKFPSWSWSAASSPARTVSYLPPDKQFLVTRNVPCHRRLDEHFAGDAGEGESMVPDGKEFGLGVDGAKEEGEEGWLRTGGSMAASQEVRVKDVRTVDESGNVAAQEEEEDEIPDMEDEDDDEEAIIRENRGGNGTQGPLRKYTLYITYTPYYRTPRFYLSGYSSTSQPLTPNEMMQDVVGDYKDKTVTLEDFPFFDPPSVKMASVHPCKHASVMKVLLDRADAALKLRLQKLREGKEVGKGDAGLEGLVDDTLKLKLTEKEKRKEEGGEDWEVLQEGGGEDEEVAIRVDQYLVVFLKFMASVTPGIEHDFTMGV